MGYELVALDCDGVLVDTVSSWQWIHDHFGVDNQDAYEAYFRDEIDGIEFMRRDIALWKGIDPDISLDRIKAILMRIPAMRGIDELTSALARSGCRTVIISGGLDLLVDEMVKRIGAWRGYSNGLGSDEHGRLTGEGILKVEPRTKQVPLAEVMDEMGIGRKDVAAVGDTRGDTSMFDLSAMKIAFNPQDDIIRSRADVVIEEKDLTRLVDVLM